MIDVSSEQSKSLLYTCSRGGRLGSEHARNYPGCVICIVDMKLTPCMRLYCLGVHWKRIVLEWGRKHTNHMRWTTTSNFSIRHTMTNSRKQQQMQLTHCCSMRAAAAKQVHDRYTQIHTRAWCSSVQYHHNIPAPGQVTLLCNRTRSLYLKEKQQ